MRKFTATLCVALVAGALAANADTLEELKAREGKVKAVVEKVMPTVVCIQPDGNGQGSGSGVIISKDGLIMTAAHVTQATGKKLTILFPDGRQVKGVSLGANRSTDGGLAKITEPADQEWPFAEMGSSDKMKLGDWCVAMGHPGGFSYERRPPVRLGRVWRRDFDGAIFSSCPLIGGDSGGPLFDLEGKVIGINSSIHGNTDMNRHVAVDTIREDWERMIKDQTWGRAVFTQVLERRRPVTGADYDKESQEGVKITEVNAELPAGKAGLKKGDVIVKFNGKAVETFHAFQRMLGSHRAGDKVKLTFRREGKDEEVELELASRAAEAPEPNEAREIRGPKIDPPKTGPQPWLGASAEDGSSKGARILSVLPDGPAARAGLVAGDVIESINDKEVKDAAALAEEIAALKPGEKISVKTRRGELDQTIELDIGLRP